MTEAEVIQAVGATHLKRISRQKFQGMYSDLIIPAINIGNFQFDIVFQMDDSSNQLMQVLLIHQGDPAKGCAGPSASACETLSERFGRPERVGTSEAWSWRFPTTSIEVATLDIEEVTADVYVRFFPTSSDRGAKHIAAF